MERREEMSTFFDEAANLIGQEAHENTESTGQPEDLILDFLHPNPNSSARTENSLMTSLLDRDDNGNVGRIEEDTSTREPFAAPRAHKKSKRGCKTCKLRKIKVSRCR